MPRNVRNFWIELEVDGNKTKVATGPVRKDGGFRMTILRRAEGGIANEAMLVRGRVDGEGFLVLEAHAQGQNETISMRSRR